MIALAPKRRRTALKPSAEGWSSDDGYHLSIGRGRSSRRLIGELKTPDGEIHMLAGRTAEGGPDLVDWAEDLIAKHRAGGSIT